jgi:hypothetical protein
LPMGPWTLGSWPTYIVIIWSGIASFDSQKVVGKTKQVFSFHHFQGESDISLQLQTLYMPFPTHKWLKCMMSLVFAMGDHQWKQYMFGGKHNRLWSQQL